MAGIIDRLSAAAGEANRRFAVAVAGSDRLEDALSGAIDPQKLIDNCAEAWRVSADQAKALLAEQGFGPIFARLRPMTGGAADETTGSSFSSTSCYSIAGGRIHIRAFSPSFDEPRQASKAILDSVDSGLNAFVAQSLRDPLGVLYRDKPLAFAETWLREVAPAIRAYLGQHFAGGAPRYIVNSGIGANEQFNYLVAALANERPNNRVVWLLANSPKEIARLPADATTHNTLFIEFSRSGITEETVKLHEFTPRAAKRIVFANTGPLRDLAERDGNLVLKLPDEVSGRYGRNKTPILLAPMHVVGMDVIAYWRSIQAACDELDLSQRTSAPAAIAHWIRVQQLRRGVDHVYLGTNDDLLRYSADEFCQFWNEGVNRDGNDITMSRYLGLPRDSHMNLEAILGTSERKIAVFLLNAAPKRVEHDMAGPIDSIRPAHAGLTIPEVDLILALANVKRCSEKMPTLLVTVSGVDLAASAWLGQLWADITLVYSRLIGVDPGSNPEVKNVRTRAADWLANKHQAFELLK